MKKLLAVFLAVAMLLGCTAMAEVEVKEFPEVPADYSKVVDSANPLRTLYEGAYRVPVTVGEAERSMLVYFPASYAQTQGFVLIVPASGTSAAQCLEEGGWKVVADEQGMLLMLPEPGEEAYDLSPDGADYAFLAACAKKAGERNYWFQTKGRDYIVGYGDGASLAVEYAEATVNSWSGLVAFGDLNLTAEDIKNKSGADLPVWLFVSDAAEEEALIDLFRGYNGCTDEVFSSAVADRVYFPNQKTNDLLLNDQPLSQVRVTVAADAAAYVADRAAQAYDFLHIGTREVGYGAKAMRYAFNVDEWGATVETVDVDGITRSWIQYVPSKLRETAEGKVPLLVALHGNALNGEYYAERSGFIRMAEEFGFIIAFPTGSISNGITPTWNITKDETKWNDVAFLEAMIAKIESEQPIDTARRYLFGHSMGGMFSQHLISYMDGVFAAVCATGCTTEAVTVGPYTHETPIWIITGDNDLMGTSFQAPEVAHYIAMFREGNGLGEAYGQYRSGRYQHYVWRNAQGADTLRFSLCDEMAHTTTLDQGLYFFNWLSQFSRGENGECIYQGGIYNAK
ncbi:MAG: hypothetical protein IJ189_03605 [Clostridia bacterium]|nr:hypothetical protein [Clostridia bacterium]